MDQTFILTTVYIMAGILGLCVGSFLNVVIYRVPEHMSLATPPSHCPACNYKLRWYDNIPVLSYCLLRGKCRNCGVHISFRYTIVELANMLLWLGCVLRFGKESIIYAGICAVACSVLLCVFFIDLEHSLIFNRFVIILLVLSVASCFFDKTVTPLSHLIGLATGAGLFLLVFFIGYRIYKKEALGGGDIKLAAACGFLLGWQGFIISMLIASVSGSIILMTLRNRRRDDKEHEYPFAPFIVAGTLIALFFGKYIVDLYMNLLHL